MSDVSEISFEVENCGSKILATSNLVVLACPTDSENKGKISVYLNDTMTLVEELQANFTDSFLGEQMQIVESKNGK